MLASIFAVRIFDHQALFHDMGKKGFLHVADTRTVMDARFFVADALLYSHPSGINSALPQTNTTINSLGPCTPYAKTCAISADRDGPEINSALVGKPCSSQACWLTASAKVV